MTYTQAIEWLKKRKYDDDMILGDQRRIKHNEEIDRIIMLLSLHIEKPDRVIEDCDCPSGACPIR